MGGGGKEGGDVQMKESESQELTSECVLTTLIRSLTPGLLAVIHVLLALLLSFSQHFGFEGAFKKMKRRFVFPSRTN
jgi:hypothetical protein